MNLSNSEHIISYVAKSAELSALDDWLYLIHHIHVDDDSKKEILHHCRVVDHLGNLYNIEHIIDCDGNTQHCLVGLIDGQDIFWSDEDANEQNIKIPCSNRQLKD